MYLSLHWKNRFAVWDYFPQHTQPMGYYTIIFGGVSLEENIISLLLIILVTQLVAGITIGIKGIVKRGSSVVKEA